MRSSTAKLKKRKGIKGFFRELVKNKWLYIMAIPIIAYFVVFSYVPMFGLVMGFQKYRPALGVTGSEFVGFQYFNEFFTHPNFWRIMRNTFIMSLLGLVVEFPLTIVFALLLNEITVGKIKKSLQTISYMPYFISTVVICSMIREFVSASGAITDILVAFGMDRQNLLTDPNYFWMINMFSNIWTNLGYGSIIFVSAITQCNQELYEAAAIDGATRLQRVWHVTIPQILPTIITMLILKCGTLMTGGFEKVLLLYNPSIYSTADTISTHVQRYGIESGNFGYATAVGLFNSVMNTALLLISNFFSKRAARVSVV